MLERCLGVLAASVIVSVTPPHASGEAAVNGTRLYYEVDEFFGGADGGTPRARWQLNRTIR